MKLKVLTVFGSAAFLVAGCGGGANNANTNANANRSNNAAVVTSTATPSAPAADPAVKSAVEAALKAKGFNEVTVDATTSNITLRGTVPKGKLDEAVRAAQEAGKKPVNNQISEK